jgi:hypothetical protein
MQTASNSIGHLISAMNKMAEEMSFDCDACEYNEVCGDVEELRSMRDKLGRDALKDKETAANA